MRLPALVGVLHIVEIINLQLDALCLIALLQLVLELGHKVSTMRDRQHMQIEDLAVLRRDGVHLGILVVPDDQLRDVLADEEALFVVGELNVLYFLFVHVPLLYVLDAHVAQLNVIGVVLQFVNRELFLKGQSQSDVIASLLATII